MNTDTADNRYKLRAECTHDLKELSIALGTKGDVLQILRKKRPDKWTLPGDDHEAIIETSLSLDKLRKVIKRVPDGHVMYQSVNDASDYTGERWYTTDWLRQFGNAFASDGQPEWDSDEYLEYIKCGEGERC